MQSETELDKILDLIEEQKKSLRPNENEEENLTEFEYCRKYSKTRSMPQD